MDRKPFADAIKNGDFVLTAECRPSRSADPAGIKECGDALKTAVHAVSAPESEDGVRLSSFAACSHLASTGAEPLLHLLTRDMNRIALQSAILGAASIGIRNLLCTSGRHQALTTSASARGVYDLDPIQFLRVADKMRKDGELADGQSIGGAMELLLGTDTNPFADPMELQVLGLESAVAAGADFVITQPVFDLDKFNIWMTYVRERGIHERTCIIASVLPLTSTQEAVRLAEKYNTIDIRDEDVERLSGVSDQRMAGIHLASETIAFVRKVKGVRGIHLVTGDDFQLALDVIKSGELSRS